MLNLLLETVFLEKRIQNTNKFMQQSISIWARLYGLHTFEGFACSFNSFCNKTKSKMKPKESMSVTITDEKKALHGAFVSPFFFSCPHDRSSQRNVSYQTAKACYASVYLELSLLEGFCRIATLKFRGDGFDCVSSCILLCNLQDGRENMKLQSGWFPPYSFLGCSQLHWLSCARCTRSKMELLHQLLRKTGNPFVKDNE